MRGLLHSQRTRLFFRQILFLLRSLACPQFFLVDLVLVYYVHPRTPLELRWSHRSLRIHHDIYFEPPTLRKLLERLGRHLIHLDHNAPEAIRHRIPLTLEQAATDLVEAAERAA